MTTSKIPIGQSDIVICRPIGAKTEHEYSHLMLNPCQSIHHSIDALLLDKKNQNIIAFFPRGEQARITLLSQPVTINNKVIQTRQITGPITTKELHLKHNEKKDMILAYFGLPVVTFDNLQTRDRLKQDIQRALDDGIIKTFDSGKFKQYLEEHCKVYKESIKQDSCYHQTILATSHGKHGNFYPLILIEESLAI